MRRTLACLGSLTLVSGKTYFSETFDDSWESRWVKSEWKKRDKQDGEFRLSTGKWFADEKEDKGLQTSQDMKFYDISASFDSFSNKGKKIIIQYQLKYEKDIECGGGYIKVGPKMADGGKTFGDPTPYNIMFGPDKCGYTKRTHLIFSYKGRNVLKKTDIGYKQDVTGTSHLYRLTLEPDTNVKVEIDGENMYEGLMKEGWEVLGPKEMPDPEDKKPKGWIDEATIDDPTDSKPEDWAEEKRILDESAKKPDDWDDEEDGEWEAPMKDNPAFKGEWHVKSISNPEYKGAWEQKFIPNPEYVDDPEVYKYDFGFVGIDLWQVKAETIFDNIIITDELAEAEAFAEKWKSLSKVETEKKTADEAKDAEATKKADEESDDDDDEDDKKAEEM